MIITKICRICNNEYPLNKTFWPIRKKKSRDGFRHECRKCTRIRTNEYRNLRKEKLGDDFKDWRKMNPEKGKESGRKYYQKNKEKLLLKNKERYEKNKDRYLAQIKEYRKEHKEEKAKWDREWQKKNPEKRAIINKKYNSNPKNKIKSRIAKNKRYQRDPKVRLHNSMSCGLRNCLKNKGGQKAFDLLPYNINQLKSNLEKQFTDGMSWDNYGDWHVDHKIPVSAFNFTEPEHEDFKRCWDLKNLQPLWAMENMTKGAKLEKPFQPSLPI